ncbi:sodium:solute symporter family transporter [Salinicoccus roseus]|uniref:sodium:solute symporter family transporter n=1 Tax=Salinicoccus roseus TaxID=45670 RepID=UPI0035634619
MGWYIFYFVLYFIFMLGIAAFYFRRITTYEDYLISSWNTGFCKITGTIISTFCGAAVFIGWVGLGFTVGLSGYWKFAFVAIVFSLILILGFAKPLRRQRLITMADLFTVRFGGKAGGGPRRTLYTPLRLSGDADITARHHPHRVRS